MFVHGIFSLGHDMNIFECALDQKSITKLNVDIFWKEVLQAWAKIKSQKEGEQYQLHRPIRFNHNMRLEEQPNLSVKRLLDRGICYVKYIYSFDEKRFLTTRELITKFPRIDFVSLSAVRASIPITWLEPDSAIHRSEVRNNDIISDIKKCPQMSKWSYNILLRNVTDSRASSQIKWENELALTQNFRWHDVYSQLYLATNSIQLRWLQFRILHRILPTRKLLQMYGIIADNVCSFCKQHPETISHLF